jgi:hypothetical protein
MINIDPAKGAHIDLGQAGELPIQSQTRTLLGGSGDDGTVMPRLMRPDAGRHAIRSMLFCKRSIVRETKSDARRTAFPESRSIG